MLKTLTLIFLFSFGTEKIENLPPREPRALSADPEMHIYLADTGNNRIIKFDRDGKLLRTVGGFGWSKEQFDTPMDICAKSALDIFVADYNNNRIERYDKDLNYISSLYPDENKSEDLQFGYPCGVAVSIHGELVLVDSENKRLLKINSFGEPEISFGDFAEGKGKLDDPQQVEISADDKIFVSDKAANRIIVFDYFGNYLSEIGNGILADPSGIFIDDQNHLWVANSGKQEILAFSLDGELITRWKATDANKTFKNPIDIVSINNRVYVLDQDLIHVFEIKQVTGK